MTEIDPDGATYEELNEPVPVQSEPDSFVLLGMKHAQVGRQLEQLYKDRDDRHNQSCRPLYESIQRQITELTQLEAVLRKKLHDALEILNDTSVTVYEVYISGREWQGGDYNGGYSGFNSTRQFSTKEKAQLFMDTYQQPLYSHEKHLLSGPHPKVIK